ncbi:MAG: hypothetical protein C7B43_16260 [Sulfobacillus benefaciens]|uniref:Uncharacterized protein n=1 Tax=Sulfobacillus benefaciens TaxID=453960 RepID=A0A2T2WTV1_9FIRM|nr:MAG: hypothetical protein C7B43_16260 [Sulfobacillus benefaciens]
MTAEEATPEVLLWLELPNLSSLFPSRTPPSGVIVKGTAILLDPPAGSLTDDIITRSEAMRQAREFFTVLCDPHGFPVRALLANVTNPGFVQSVLAWIVTIFLPDSKAFITSHMDWMADSPPPMAIHHGTVAFAPQRRVNTLCISIRNRRCPSVAVTRDQLIGDMETLGGISGQ